MNPTRRQVLKSLSAAAMAGLYGEGGDGASVAAGSDSAKPQPGAPAWHRRCLVGIEWGPTGANDKDAVYMSKARGKAIIEDMVKARSEYAVLFMKDMNFAYYDSRVCASVRTWGLRDLLRECIDEAQKHKMPVVAYCQIQYDTSSWRAHPEWRMKDPEGKDLPDSRLCYRSDYLGFIEKVAAEMMEYPIAGFHFDMLDFGFFPPVGCWCERCRTAYRAKYRGEMPPGITWDDAWDKMLEFRCDSNTEFCRKLEAFVESRRPDISVDFNYHGYPPFNWLPGERPVQHAQSGDFVTSEGLPFVFGHYNPGLLALLTRSARRDGCVQVATSRSVYDYHDFTVRPVPDLKWEVMTYLAHGAQCTVVDKANYDGTDDAVVYERLGAIFDEAQRKRELFGHAAVQEVGLYYSHRSRDWYARQDAPKYMAAVWGAHKALVQSHVTMGFLFDENLSLDALKAFPLVYLPNAAVLSDAEATLLHRYVSEGGRLLITGLSGTHDRFGQPTQRTVLEGVAGVRLERLHLEHMDNYLVLPRDLAEGEAKPLLEGIPADWPMLTWGPMAAMQTQGAAAFGRLMLAFRSQDNQWSRRMSPEKTAGPAVFLHRLGKGVVLTVPCAVDAAYAGDYRMPEHRKLIRNLVRLLLPDPEIRVEAPLHVEAVVTRDAPRKRVYVHFLSFSAPATSADVAFANGRRVLPPLMEEPARYRASVQLRRAATKVRAANPTTRLALDARASSWKSTTSTKP